MKNNFLSLVAKMPQNTGGGNSQTKRATFALPLRYLCAMLLALVLGVGQMWGAERQIPTTVLTLPTTGLSSTWSSSFTASHYYYHDNTNHYVIYYPYAVRMSESTQTWVADDGGGSTEISDGYSSTGIFKGFTYFNALDGSSKKRCDKLAKSTGTIVTYRVTNCTAVSAYIKLGKKKDVVHLKCYVMTEDTPAESAAKSDSYTDESSASTGILNLTGLDAKKEYLVEIYNAGGGSNAQFYEIAFYYPVYTVTYDLNGGTGTTPTEDDQPLGAKFDLHDGVTGITPPTGQEFLKWKDQDADEYDGGDEYTMPAKNVTLTAQWGTAAPKYDITFNNGGHGTAPSATNASKVTLAELSASGWVHTGWVANQNVTVDEATVTAGTKIANGKTAHLSANTEFTAQWSQLYEIAKGTHTNGDIAIDLAEAVADATVTLTATPDENYVFSAWDVYKTGESSTKVSVTDNTFTMPAYAVTVNATFAVDERTKVLYVTANSADATKANDKLYAALKDTYNVKIVGPTSDVDQSGYALVVLHESIGGGSHSATAVAAAKAGNVPVLNTKSYFYNSDRWGWGTPNAGQSVKGATLNSAYCNIASHPLFSGVTMTAGFFEITDDAAAKCMQPVGSFTSGKEGYTLATTPNNGEGNGCAIHELTPAQRGASAGKYLMISVSGDKLNALNANGQKLFQNAAAYLTGSTTWDPISVPTSPEVTATPSENYTEGNTITLTASATGTSASTTYTWYKGDNWAAASATTPVQAAATAASDGNVFTKTAALADAGTYWCNISNGTSCDAQASVTITVSSASTPTHTISYDNVKGADMTAYPTEYTEGIGVASFDPLADITGWHFVEWSPASIATTAITDQTITAVWAQVFEVTFDLRGHGASIDAQNIVDGGKVTKPDDPVAIGYDFGGWFTDEECTAGNEFDFDTPITAATPLYAKWTAFDGCTLLVPATSGENAGGGDAIVMQTGSKGATMTALAIPDGGSLAYTANGLAFNKKSGVKTNVVLNNDMKVGTKISLKLVAGGDKTRGLFLYTKTGTKIEAFTCWVEGENPAVENEEETFTYTVVADDGLEGTNEFQLWRNNTVYLKQLAVTECGAAVVYHNLTSEIAPDHDPAYATVTLGASSVREGYTTTATYSDIDAAYEFDEWQISGTGASIADASANPATITMGTEDAVVTLKLKVATPKHTVTFNKMGKGADIASQLVAEGALVSEPSVTEPEGWLLEGWYKESTFENKWDFASDVMSTSDIELFANWVADTSIKLVNKSTGAINTTNFTTAVAAEADVDGEKGAVFNANRDAISSVSALNEMVQYNATTTQTKIQLVMYNTSSAEKTIHLFKVAEGDDAATLIDITIDGNSRKTTEYYTFNSDKNRSFYITVSDKKVQILQMRVVESGTALKQFGQAGYSLNLNKGRIFAKSGNAVNFEGATVTVNSDYKVLNNSNLSTNSYIQFNNAVANTTLKVTRSGGNYYVSQDPEDKGTSYNKNEEIVLSATGTWYLGSTSSGSSASFTKIEFIAPKCAEPQFNALANSDICSGDPYVALDGTATVADAGVPTYKWYAEGADESDPAAVLATTSTYTPSADGNYYVIATNHLAGYTDNTKKSDLVSVTTHSGTAITEPLVDLRGAKDAVVTLSVTASGKNLHYTWKESATIDGTYTDVAGAADENELNVTITEGMDKYYKVVVHSDCGADQESVAHVTQFVPVSQQDVTASIVWNWTEAASDNTAEMKNNTTPARDAEFIMANGDARIYNNANFWSDKLVIAGQYAVRGGNYFQGGLVKFHTTVAGVVRVTFSHTGSATEEKPARELFVNGVATGATTANTTRVTTAFIDVPAGDVSITAQYIDPTKPGNQYVRVYKIEFYAYDTERNDSWIAPGELGTICYPNGHIITGAEVYEMAGVDENNKFVFDQVEKTEPGKPYLFVATSNEPIKLYKTTAAAEVSPIANNGMIGTFVSIDLDYTDERAAKWYYFSGKKFYAVSKRTDNLNVPANRAYVDMNTPVPAGAPKHGVRRITFDVQGANVATGVENAAATDKPAKMLINGQLFILRGEKMYDAKGQLVK